jgi:hypothetical protein
MYDAATGAAFDVPLSQVGQAYTSKRLSFLEGQKIQVEKPDGTIDEVDASMADRLFSSAEMAGTALSTPGALREQQLDQTYGGVGGGALAFGSRALSSATLGLSDAAVTGAADFIGRGDAVREALAESQARNETASFAGDVVGAVAPAVLTGGESLLATGAGALGAPARFATGAGEAAGAGVRAVFGEGMAARALRAGAAGAVEGGVQGLGIQLRESSVRNEPLTVEALAASGLNAAVFGGAIGLGAGALGVGASAAGRAAARGTERVGEAASEAGRRALAKLDEVSGGLVAKGREALEGARGSSASELLEKGANAVEDLLDSRPGLRAQLGDISEKKALSSTGANLTKLNELAERGPEAVGRVARRVRDELPALSEKEFWKMGRDDIAAAARQAKEAAGNALGDFMQVLDDTSRELESKRPGINVRPDVKKIYRESIRDVVVPLEKEVFRGRQADRLREILDDFKTKTDGFSIADMHQARSKLDDLIFESQISGAKPLEQAYSKVRYRIENEIEKAGDRIIKYGELGADNYGQYKALKQRYADYVWITQAADKGAWREAANRTFGFSENMGLIAGLALGGGPGAIAGAGLQYLVRRYGDQVASSLAHAASVDGAVFVAVRDLKSKVAGSVARAMERGAVATPAAKALLEGGRAAAKGASAALGEVAGAASRVAEGAAAGARAAGRGAAAGAKGVAAGSYRWSDDRDRAIARAERLALAASSYDPADSREVAPPGLREARPDIGESLGAQNDRAAAYLAAEQPLPPLPPGPMRPRPSRPPIDQVEAFNRKVTAVKDPTSVLTFAKSPANASSDSVAAVEAVYPALLGEMRAEIAEAASNHKGTVDYKTAIRLSRIAGKPLEPSCDPAFGATMQQIYAGAEGRAAQGPTPRPSASGRSLMSKQAQPTSSGRLQEWERR